MADPLTALRRASSIGPASQTIEKAPVTQQSMGMPIPSLEGVGGALGEAGEWLAKRLGVEAPEVIQGLLKASPRVVPSTQVAPQVQPTGQEVDAITQSMRNNLSRVPQAKTTMPTANPPSSGGVGSQVFQQMNSEGAFQGDRTTGHFPEGPGGLSSITPGEWQKLNSPVAPTGGLGNFDAQFTPRGGERAYNAVQGLKSATADPLDAVYKNIMSRMGR